MRISEFEKAHLEICGPDQNLETARNLFVAAESATLRPGAIVVVGHPERARLLRRCFPGREVVECDTVPPGIKPCLLYLNRTDAAALKSVHECLTSTPALIALVESFNTIPAVHEMLHSIPDLDIRTMEADQFLVEKHPDQRPVCHWPWSEHTLYVNGDVGVCCGAGGLSNATPDSMGTAYNSDAIRTVRQNLLKGEFKGICEKCPFKTLYNQAVTGIGPRSDIVVFPKTMSLIITEKCNLKCWFCNYTVTYNSDVPNRIKIAPEMDIELLEELAPRYWKNLHSLNTNCGGEVFLYPHWNRIVELLLRYPPMRAVSTSGGGIEVREEDWYKILQSHTHWSFSVDSFDPQLHWIMRGCDIGIVRRNVDKIRRLRDAHFPDRSYGFSCVLMKLTVPTLFDFVRRGVEEYGATHFGFQHVIGNPTQDPSTEPQWRQLFNCELNKVKHYCTTHNINMGHPMGYYLGADKKPDGWKHFKYPDI